MSETERERIEVTACPMCGGVAQAISVDDPHGGPGVRYRTMPTSDESAGDGLDDLLRKHCDTLKEHYGYMSTAVEEACKLRETIRERFGRAARRLEGEEVTVYCRIDDPDQKTARVDVVEGEIPWSMNRVIVTLYRHPTDTDTEESDG